MAALVILVFHICNIPNGKVNLDEEWEKTMEELKTLGYHLLAFLTNICEKCRLYCLVQK